MCNNVIDDVSLCVLLIQSIAEKLRAEHDQRQRTTAAGISRHNSTSSVQSVTSIEVAEITATARDAEAQIAELASHSTDDRAVQPNNHNASRHRSDNDDDDDAAALSDSLPTPDGNIRPVHPTFVTIPHGQSVT